MRGPIAEFAGDLGLALRVWRVTPLLPVIAVVLAVIQSATSLVPGTAMSDFLPLLVLPVTIFTFGFYGTERIWYRRVFEGLVMGAGEVWTLSWRFLGRYLRLGGLVGLPFVLIALVIVAPVAREMRGGGGLVWWRLAALLTSTVVLDVLLTFATPALAYTTEGAWDAIGISWAMIRGLWPASAAYALVPPLAIVLFTQGTAPRLGALGLVTLAVSTLLNLLMKGATAAFYVRHHAPQQDEEFITAG